jgi:hypothetical protein
VANEKDREKLARKSMAPSVSQDSNVSSKHSSLLLKTDTDSQDEGDGSNFMKDTQHSKEGDHYIKILFHNQALSKIHVSTLCYHISMICLN